MRTTEDQAARDAALVDTGEHPPADRRSIRCKCSHSLDAHQPPRTPDEARLLPDPNAAFSSPPCMRCECRRFASRRAAWRVVPAAAPRLDVWAVVSPAGQEVYHAATRVSALTIANALAVTEQMMVRLGRVERVTVGDHPALRAARDAADQVQAARTAVKEIGARLNVARRRTLDPPPIHVVADEPGPLTPDEAAALRESEV